MKRAAIYARYSTDLQSERSTADQINLCRGYAQREGLEVVETFEDKALSGASMINRDSLLDMLSQARAGHFDVIVVEALDRLSRDMEDLAGIHKRLQFCGVEIRAVHDGPVNTVLVGLRGLVGQLYREDNVHKIRRGLSGRIKQGLSAGGRAYGYRPDPNQKGQLLINEDEAKVVRRIFKEFLAGSSPRSIAQRLNRDGIQPPRGDRWNASTINGNYERGTGILHNHLYDGKLAWNKVRMIRDPDTGKRLSRPNPRGAWEIADVREYRILPEGQFEQAAQLRSPDRRKRPEQYRRPKRILSGLLKCEACGAGMTACGKDRSGRVRIRCSAARESGTCPDPKTFYLDAVERVVIDALAAELRSPEHVVRFVEIYVQERKRLVTESNRAKASLAKKVAQKKREMDRIVDAIANGSVNAPDVRHKMDALRSERDRLQAELESVPTLPEVVELHPMAMKRYEEKLLVLKDELQRGLDDGNGVGANALRDLLETVVVGRHPDMPGGIRVHITGKLNALIGAPGFGATSVVNGGSGGGT